MRVPRAKQEGRPEDMHITWRLISSDQESQASEIQFENPYPHNSSFQKENVGI